MSCYSKISTIVPGVNDWLRKVLCTAEMEKSRAGYLKVKLCCSWEVRDKMCFSRQSHLILSHFPTQVIVLLKSVCVCIVVLVKRRQQSTFYSLVMLCKPGITPEKIPVGGKKSSPCWVKGKELYESMCTHYNFGRHSNVTVMSIV